MPGPSRSLPKALCWTALLICLALWPRPTTASTAAHPAWWDQAQATAREHQYRIIDSKELWAVLANQGDALVLDVRPDYEFKRGHLPGARNLEFHLGHRTSLPPDMAEAFKKLVGDDPNRRVIIYCRSFR